MSRPDEDIVGGPGRPRWSRVLPVLLALVVTACSGPEVPQMPPVDPVPVPAPATGEATVRGCAPEQPLLPAATLDACGLQITESINARLMRPDPVSGQPMPDLATAIETNDSQNFTVRLARGRQFHNGTEVKARNFVAAWNYAAYGPNGMLAQDWFALIEGGAAMNCPVTGDCSRDDRPTELTGLRVVDDHTFTIRTVRPIVDFQTRLSHPVFSPLPDEFFAIGSDKTSFAGQPIGSGPFRFASRTDNETVLEAWSAYEGEARPAIAKVTLKRYDAPQRDADAIKAYRDVVGNTLDVTSVIPTDQLADDVWRSDLPERTGVGEPRAVQQLVFVGSDARLSDVRLRRAISQAIDREALSRQVFAGTRSPATSWVAPAVPGYRADACGDLCTYDLAESRRLFAAAGGYQGVFHLTVNGDDGNKEWADAVCGQLKNALELDCQVTVLDNRAAVIRALEAGELSGVVQQVTRLHYLSPEPYLSAYASTSRQNRTGYRNARYDAQLAAALEATTQAGANQAYREAELVLTEDPPSVPLWVTSTPYAWSNRVTDVRLTTTGSVDLSALRRV